MMTTPQLVVQNLNRRYPSQTVDALSNVSFSIHQGEFIALMGPSGCGKSTLLNLLGLMDNPNSGQITFENTELTHLSAQAQTEFRKKNIGFVFQFFNLLPTLTVIENIALPLSLNHASHQEAYESSRKLLADVGIREKEDAFPAQLSGGQMQRVAIARALVHNPKLIIADEPTGNLDTETGKSILTLLKTASKQNGQTVIMATHSEEVTQYADKVIRLIDGKIVE